MLLFQCDIRCPVSLIVYIRELVCQPYAAVANIGIAEFQRTIYGYLLAQHIAVLIVTVIAVVIAEEIYCIAVFDIYLALCDCISLAVNISVCRTDDLTLGLLVGERRGAGAPDR